MSSSSVPVRRQLILKNNPDGQLHRRIFTHIKSRLFDNLSEVRSNAVISIALQSQAVFNFDLVEYEGIQVESRQVYASEKFLRLCSLVENQSRCEPTAIPDFLELLLNLYGLRNTSASIERLIKQEFGDDVDIEEEVIFTPGDSQNEPFISSSESLSPSEKKTLTNILDIFKVYPKSTIFIFLTLILICGVIMFRKEVLALLHAILVASVTLATSSLDISTTTPNTKSTVYTDIVSSVNTNLTTSTNAIFSTNSPEITQSPQLTLKEIVSTEILPKYKVKVKSYTEFIDRMSNLPLKHEVIVSLVIRNPLDWPLEQNIKLPNTFLIDSLLIDGPIVVDSLIDILSQTTNIKLLYIRNTGDKLCQRNQGQLNLVKGINKRVYLPLLKSLVIQYFTSCAKVYEALATYVEPLRQIKSIVIHSGVIDDLNQVFILKMLENNKDSLKEVKFAQTRINLRNILFEDKVGSLILPKVEIIRLDSVSSDGDEQEIPIGKSISKILSNLKVMYSSHGFVEWFKFPGILQCKNLTKLGIGIRVPEGRTFFDVSFFKKYLPNVTVAHINLVFSTCKKPENGFQGRNEIIGWENVKSPLYEVVIRSNCKIHAIISNTAMSLNYYKIQEYKRDNGKYIFTYKNK